MAYLATNNWGPWQGVALTNILTSWNPGTTPATNTVDLSTVVPVGTKAIGGWYRMTSSAVGDSVVISKTGAGESCSCVQTLVANQPTYMWFEVELSASYTFDVIASNLDISDVDVIMTKIACG